MPLAAGKGTSAGLAGQPLKPGIPREDFYIFRKIPDAPVFTLERQTSIYRLLEKGPLLFTLVYTRCNGVCYPMIRSLRSAVERLGGLGTDYRILVLSFDPRDEPEDMAAMARVEGLSGHPHWIFGTTGPENIRQLVASVGYWRQPDSLKQQVNHPAVLIGLNRNGQIVRFLVGASIAPARLAEVIKEMRGEFVPSYPLPRKNVIFSCFQYQADKGLKLNWGFALLLMPGVVTLGGSLWIFHRGAHQRRSAPGGF
ncbi:MAG: SCO family protein [Calditrichaeota bacterium]|nr:MAG: SCO family protein [Calditrichota bacterium]